MFFCHYGTVKPSKMTSMPMMRMTTKRMTMKMITTTTVEEAVSVSVMGVA